MMLENCNSVRQEENPDIPEAGMGFGFVYIDFNLSIVIKHRFREI